MTDQPTESDDDEESDSKTTQLGARVDKDLAQLVRGLVRHKHGKIRGPLGRSYEKALQYFLAVHLFQHPNDFDAIIEATDIEDEDRAREKLRDAVDEVGPDLTGVKQALENEQHDRGPRAEPAVSQGTAPQPARVRGSVHSAEQAWEESSMRNAVVGEDMAGNEEMIQRIAAEVRRMMEEEDG